METEGKVSIWLYNCKSKDALNEYIDLKYDEDGEIIASPFYSENNINIDEVDEYLLEKEWFLQPITDLKDVLSRASYSEKFINQIPDDISQTSFYNSIILLYNFEFLDTTKVSPNSQFIGTFQYK